MRQGQALTFRSVSPSLLQAPRLASIRPALAGVERGGNTAKRSRAHTTSLGLPQAAAPAETDGAKATPLLGGLPHRSGSPRVLLVLGHRRRRLCAGATPDLHPQPFPPAACSLALTMQEEGPCPVGRSKHGRAEPVHRGIPGRARPTVRPWPRAPGGGPRPGPQPLPWDICGKDLAALSHELQTQQHGSPTHIELCPP